MSDAVYGAVLERVRELAQDTFNIYWTSHAQERMDERDIVDAQALRVVREGNLLGELELDGGDWKMTLSKHCSGRLVHVVVALSESQLIVITAY
ncbi:MAG: DUF4258 domain-containing protein [Gammaproteobacteria bacterium]|nr:DUF4258 domain-containing protein [Gammaproteobacteria bacterium]MDE0442918.1 DUF4258 domain-containing protein [Gammaproteobacteria bacterium]